MTGTLPKIFRRLFENEGRGPKLRRDIIPVTGFLPGTVLSGEYRFGGQDDKHPIDETSGEVDLSWALCDGGTYTSPDGREVTVPDLRDKFIIGAGASYAIGATGGGATATTKSAGAHTHTQGNSGATTLTVAQIPNHNHGIPAPIVPQTGTSAYCINNQYFILRDPEYGIPTARTGGGGSHTHTNPATGSAGAHTHTVSTLPPYYALAYIMKL